jgi:DNA (cytosine-5)-methyltransferase 1
MRRQFRLDLNDELAVDNFAGGGGASMGIENALGRHVDHAINHDALALGMHRINHPQTVHHTSDVFDIDPLALTEGRRVGLGWFSPDCKHFSKAKGGRPLDKKIRGLVLVILKWAKIRLRVAYMENVEEIRTWGPLLHHKKHAADCNCGKPCGMPDPKHKGRTWKAFLDALSTGLDENHPDMPEILEVLAGSVTKEELVRGFGYHYELREIRGYVYGAATIRRRLFMIARCDGMPVVWPPESHAAPKDMRRGRKPYRIIAECIDWERRCPSIFLTKIQARKLRCRRPLKTPTLRRVATGVGRYVIHSKRPFIVCLTHQGGERIESVDEPAKTVTGAHRGEKALVDASLAPFITEHANATHQRNFPIDEPGRTQCGEVKGGHFALVAGTLVQTGYGEREGQEPRVPGVDKPLGTIVAGGGKHAVVSAHLMRNFKQSVGQSVYEPAPTVMPNGGGKTALISGTLVRTAHGDQDKNGKKRGRGANDLRESMSTVLGTQEFAFAAAHLTKFNTGSVGSPMDQPAPTIPAGNHRPETHGGAATPHGLVAVNLVEYHSPKRPGDERVKPVTEPLPVQTTEPRFGLVASSMVKLRGNAKTHAPGSTVDSPVHTISADGEHHALSCAYLAQHNAGNNSNPGHPATEPISTVSQKGSQQQVVSASLAAYYGSEADGQAVDESLRAVTTKPRFGLAVSEAVTPGLTPEQITGARRVAKFLRKFGVEFEGEFATVGEFVIIDIGMRMLTPRELFRAQGFPEDYVIDRAWLVNPKTGEIVEVKLSKESQIRMCGNSVCPDVAEALVRANNPEMVVFSPEERRTRLAAAWRRGDSELTIQTPVSCAAR